MRRDDGRQELWQAFCSLGVCVLTGKEVKACPGLCSVREVPSGVGVSSRRREFKPNRRPPKLRG